MTREAVIVAGSENGRWPSKKGTTRNWRSDDMAAAVIAELMKRTGIDPALIDDVVIGCAMPEGAQGLNFGRSIALRAGLPVERAGHDGQPLLLQRRANHRPVGRADYRQWGRHHHCRWCGDDEPGADDRVPHQP